MTFDGWKTHWGPSRENQPSREPLAWRKSPNADRPLHAHTAADYTLEDPTFNDASSGAPGFRGHRLPPLPPESFQERSSPAASSVRGDTLRSDGTTAEGCLPDGARYVSAQMLVRGRSPDCFGIRNVAPPW